MKVLAISFDLPPLLRPQAIQIGRLLYHLPEDIQIVAVTSDDSSCVRDMALYPGLSRRFRERLVHRFPCSRLRRMARLVARVFLPIPDAYFFWHRSVLSAILDKWQKPRFDVIVTFAFPMSTNLLGMWLRKRYRLRWVAFLSDPWANNPHLRYSWVTNLINAWLERSVFAAADTLVFPSQEMRDMYAERYPAQKGKLACLSHSYDPTLYVNRMRSRKGVLLLRYIGGFYGQRSAECLLTALGNLRKRGFIAEGEIVFETVGSVSSKHAARYASLIKRDELEGIVRIGQPVPYLRSLELMQQSDVLVLLDAALEGSVYFPSKLADYIGAKRPILAITPHGGASARIVRQMGGWVAAPDVGEEIEEKLLSIINAANGGQLEDHVPSADVTSQFSVETTAAKAAEIIRTHGKAA